MQIQFVHKYISSDQVNNMNESNKKLISQKQYYINEIDRQICKVDLLWQLHEYVNT